MTSQAKNVITLTGELHTWEMFDHKRMFGEVTLPYSQFSQFFMAVRYNAMNGKGQQREINEPHVKKLKAAMETGKYTPAPGAASLNKEHREALTITPGGRFTLEVDADNPLLLTDANHRIESISRIIANLSEQLKKETDKKEVDKLNRWLEQAKAAPVTVTMYFDGDPKEDFANLQLGRPVDSAHMFSLKVQSRLSTEPAQKLAFETAKILQKQQNGAFQNIIRFDSRGESPLPITTLCATGASDLASSLVGLAKVALAFKVTEPSTLAGIIAQTYDALSEADADVEDGLLSSGKLLAPVVNGGKKGQATMLIGVAIALGYRVWSDGRTQASDEELAALVGACDDTLNSTVSGSLSGPQKRQLLGKFASAFLKDMLCERWASNGTDLPIGLLRILTPSSYGAAPLPKESKPKAEKDPKPKAEKKGKKKANSLPDVDGPVVVSSQEEKQGELAVAVAACRPADAEVGVMG